MSMTKLTLSAPPEIIARAERLAKERHTSISAMFVNYVRTLDAGNASEEAIAPITQSLTGVISLPEDFDEAEAISGMIAEKYGVKL